MDCISRFLGRLVAVCSNGNFCFEKKRDFSANFQEFMEEMGVELQDLFLKSRDVVVGAADFDVSSFMVSGLGF